MRVTSVFSRSKFHSSIRRTAHPTKIITETLIPTKPPNLEKQFISVIKSSKRIQHLKQIHAQLFSHGLSQNSYLITHLITSCSFFKTLDYALLIFHNFEKPNVFIFNSLIRAFSDNSFFEEALSYFSLMLRIGAQPDHLTFPFVLKSAASLVAVAVGNLLHSSIIKIGLEIDLFIRISLIEMYLKFGLLDPSWKIFDETPERSKRSSILLWNVLINGCCKLGDTKMAYDMFVEMPERSISTWNTLINGFLREGDLDTAVTFFDQMPERNVVSWTTMISGYSNNGYHELALNTFYRMLDEGFKPNDFTIISVLSACSKIGALACGTKIHTYILDNKFHLTRSIGTSLVDMYSKCGKIECASRIFYKMKEKDILTWSVMIAGFAIHGCCNKALECFQDMISSGTRPDDVAFLAVLTACSHSGLIEEGVKMFNNMKINYFIEPNLKHYACMVDLFGRAGQLNRALQFIETMPIKPDFVIWGALFSACRAHKNIEMAELASDKLLQLHSKHPGSYVFLSNIYAATERWDDVEEVRIKMKNKAIEKVPACSYIEIGGLVHRFFAGDQEHPRIKDIYSKLEDINIWARTQGYAPNTDWVLHNIEEEDKEDALVSHSEKLALAFGLLSTSEGITLRIAKNLRVCGDCHSLFKYASKMSKREIILRDIKRFHHFRDGICTCGDYW